MATKKNNNDYQYILFVFCLFQFGIPICFAIDENYYTYHLINFNNEILIEASIYTILSMSLLATSLSVMLSHKKRMSGRNLLVKSSAINDKKTVTSVSKTIFMLTSIMVLPLYLYVTYLSLSNGFSQQTRAILSSSNVFNIARAFFTVQESYIYAITMKSKKIN